MRKFLIGLLLLIVSVAASDTPAQMTLVACSRQVIGSYPEDQARPVLQLLDEARPVADEFMHVFSRGDLSEIHRRYPRLEVFFNKDPKEGVQLQLPGVFPTIGAPIRYDYLYQEVLYTLSHPQIDPRGTITTSYTLWANRFGNDQANSDRLYVLIQTRKVTDTDTEVTSAILYGKWAESRFAKEQRVDESRKCVGMENGLRVKSD